MIFTWRLQRKVSQSLTLQHEHVMYLPQHTLANRKLIHRYVDVYEYPDGRIELRTDGACVAYQRYDKLPQVDTAAIVENKRLGHALQVANLVQQQRDNRRSQSAPAHTNLGRPVRKPKAEPQRKTQRQLNAADLEEAIKRCWH